MGIVTSGVYCFKSHKEQSHKDSALVMTSENNSKQWENANSMRELTLPPPPHTHIYDTQSSELPRAAAAEPTPFMCFSRSGTNALGICMSALFRAASKQSTLVVVEILWLKVKVMCLQNNLPAYTSFFPTHYSPVVTPVFLQLFSLLW